MSFVPRFRIGRHRPWARPVRTPTSGAARSRRRRWRGDRRRVAGDVIGLLHVHAARDDHAGGGDCWRVRAVRRRSAPSTATATARTLGDRMIIGRTRLVAGPAYRGHVPASRSSSRSSPSSSSAEIPRRSRRSNPTAASRSRANAVLARLGQLHHVHPPVAGVAPAREQAVGLHGVEVMGQGGLADPDRRRQLALVGHLPASLDIEEDQPHRQRAAGIGEASSKARLTARAAAERCRPIGGVRGAGMAAA